MVLLEAPIDLSTAISMQFGWYQVLHTDAAIYLPRLAGRQVLIRMYHPNVMSLSPDDWARQTSDFVNAWGGAITDITPANELNLAVEHGDQDGYWQTPDGYAEINAWLYNFAQAFRPMQPQIRLHWPALAFGHNEDGPNFVGYEICRPSIDLYDVLDIHAYWFSDNQFSGWERYYYAYRWDRPPDFNPAFSGGARYLFPGKQLFISEFGAPSSLSRRANQYKSFYSDLDSRPYILGSTSFVWSAAPWKWPELQWVNDRGLINTILAWLKGIKPPVDVTALLVGAMAGAVIGYYLFVYRPKVRSRPAAVSRPVLA